MILGGIEKALLSMLSEIDKEKYDVTLFLEENEIIFTIFIEDYFYF